MSDLNLVRASSVARVLDGGAPRRGAGQGALDLQHDAAVAVRGGRIVAVGPTAQVLAAAGRDVPTIDASGMTVLPGLVECHSHPMFASNRHWEYVRRLEGATPSAVRAAGGGIWAAITATRAADDATLVAAAERAYGQILAGGVTTLEVKSGYGQDQAHELRMLRLLKASAAGTPIDLVFTFLGAHVAPRDGTTAEAYARAVRDEMLPAVVAQGIAEFHDVSCEVGEFEAPLAADLIRAARRVGLASRVHADASSPSRGWQTAVECGAIAADHLTYTPDDEIAQVGETDTIAVLLPMAEQFYLDERRAHARHFIRNGVPVAIATDYCSSFQATSLTLTMSQACSRFRMTPAEAIVGATLNAAYALVRQGDRGSLDIGKRGDLTVLDCAHPDELGTRIGAPLVRYVIAAGRVVHGAAPPG